jgi:hypothetical protein
MNARHLCLSTLFAITLPIMDQNGALAQQGTPEQQQACTPDVMRLCSDFIPDADRIVACLKYNEPNLSPPCHVVFFGNVVEEPRKPKPQKKPQP